MLVKTMVITGSFNKIQNAKPSTPSTPTPLTPSSPGLMAASSSSTLAAFERKRTRSGSTAEAITSTEKHSVDFHISYLLDDEGKMQDFILTDQSGMPLALMQQDNGIQQNFLSSAHTYERTFAYFMALVAETNDKGLVFDDGKITVEVFTWDSNTLSSTRNEPKIFTALSGDVFKQIADLVASQSIPLNKGYAEEIRRIEELEKMKELTSPGIGRPRFEHLRASIR
jgi:hypothetical protein